MTTTAATLGSVDASECAVVVATAELMVTQTVTIKTASLPRLPPATTPTTPANIVVEPWRLSAMARVFVAASEARRPSPPLAPPPLLLEAPPAPPLAPAPPAPQQDALVVLQGREIVHILTQILAIRDRKLALVAARSLTRQGLFVYACDEVQPLPPPPPSGSPLSQSSQSTPQSQSPQPQPPQPTTPSPRLRENAVQWKVAASASLHVHGVFTPLTNCYSPSCRVGVGCYSPSCPHAHQSRSSSSAGVCLDEIVYAVSTNSLHSLPGYSLDPTPPRSSYK